MELGFFLSEKKADEHDGGGVAVPQSHITYNPGNVLCFFNGSFQCIRFNVVSGTMVVFNVFVLM